MTRHPLPARLESMRRKTLSDSDAVITIGDAKSRLASRNGDFVTHLGEIQP